MTDKKRLSFLKAEGVIFALCIIFFTVMFYFGYLDKYMLSTMLVFFSAVLFSINASVQEAKTSKKVASVNIWISAILGVAGMAMAIYFYSAGLLTI